MGETVEDLFDDIDRKVAALHRLKTSNSWRLLKGIELYVNSEFRCPLCNRGHKTNLVYMVDAEHKRIVAAWTYPDMNPVGNIGKEAIHPHADGNGKLCMGNAKKVSQLLFNGIAPGKHHRPTDLWLLMIGHECDLIMKVPCIVCGLDEYLVYAYPYGRHWVCSDGCDKLVNKTNCVRCGGYLGRGAHHNYCSECFIKESAKCDHCGELVLSLHRMHVGNQFYVCNECYDNQMGTCSECNAPLRYNMMRYKRCHACQVVECVRCYRNVIRRDTINGRCERCRPKYHCQCGNLVPASGDTCAICLAGPVEPAIVEAVNPVESPSPLDSLLDEPF